MATFISQNSQRDRDNPEELLHDKQHAGEMTLLLPSCDAPVLSYFVWEFTSPVIVRDWRSFFRSRATFPSRKPSRGHMPVGG